MDGRDDYYYTPRQKSGPVSHGVTDFNGGVELTPPAYSEVPLPPRENMSRRISENAPWWKPAYWRWRTWAIVAVVLIIAIVAGAVAGVLVTKANRYPDYSKLSYSLAEECKFLLLEDVQPLPMLSALTIKCYRFGRKFL